MKKILNNAITTVNNDKGMALVTALALGAVGMLMVGSLLYMVGLGTWTSGSKYRYQMALDSATGGMDFFTREIIQRGVRGTDLTAMGDYGGLLTPVLPNIDFRTKLTTTGTITDGTYPNATVDATFNLAFPTSPNIAVNTGIITTSRGNSSTAPNILQGGGVVNNNAGTITPMHIPYLYQTETQAQNAVNPIENAGLSAVYVY